MKRIGLQKTKRDWLLNAINPDGYGINSTTDEEKLQFIANCINSEVLIRGNIQDSIADHLQGLPSWLDIPYSNYEILRLLNSWGYVFKDEKAEDRALENYWCGVAAIILQLFSKYNIKLKG